MPKIQHKNKPFCIFEDDESMKYWDWEKNNTAGIYPQHVSPGSHIKAHSICENNCGPKCTHSWEARVDDVYHGSRCPFCTAHSEVPCCVLKSINNPIYKKIVAQIHPKSLLFLGNLTKIYPTWICKNDVCACGNHIWETTISHRVQIGNPEPMYGCPFCKSNTSSICCAKHPRSIMQMENKEKLQLIINSCKKRDITTYKIPIGTDENIEIDCPSCKHVFLITGNAISRGRWCSYCSLCNNNFCDDLQCHFCLQTSFVVFQDQTKVQSYRDAHALDLHNPNYIKPERIKMRSNKKVNFLCYVCDQVYSIILAHVTDTIHPQWCSF